MECLLIPGNTPPLASARHGRIEPERRHGDVVDRRAARHHAQDLHLPPRRIGRVPRPARLFRLHQRRHREERPAAPVHPRALVGRLVRHDILERTRGGLKIPDVARLETMVKSLVDI